MNSGPIVIFGGTFDPVHLGHIHAARCVLSETDCERVVFMPAASPPHKSGHISSSFDRLNMLLFAIENEPRMEISTLEMQMQGPNYTYKTVEKLKSRYPGRQIAWVVGMDMFQDLPNWRNARALLSEIRVIGVARPPMPDNIDGVFLKLTDFFGSDIAARLRGDILLVEPVDISSTAIRQAVSHGGKIDHMVPPKVSDYIISHGLYTVR